ncbi:MAG TPA: secretin and TonB N-terminal domain-containing protein, partial [Pseudobdellovibrionaceae bacterium]|nr:secretin and TonB N-terminal domain-containing protein [Pseudobdellovibrionaceae bacterium]
MNSKTQRLGIIALAIVLASCASMNSGDGESSSGESEVSDAQTLDQVEEPKTASNNDQDPFADEKPQEVVAAPSPAPEPTPVIQEVTQAPPAPINEAPTPEPAPQVAPQVPVSSAVEKQKIVSVKYLNNKGGGVIQVRGNGPLRYTTRKNESQHQLVIEIADAQLTDKTKRPLDFRDMTGPFGSLDAYDSKESGGAHFVVQLRDGAEWPEVTLEGSAILIMASNQMNAQGGESNSVNSAVASKTSVEESDSSALLLGSTNLKFSGKKISLETNDMDLRDALKFISEESGVNMIFSDGIQGKASLRLRQVPWDQALVILLQSKKLGYVRQGNVLRIATQAEIKAEEAEELKVLKDKNDSE